METAREEAEKAITEFRSALDADLEPVSYTHLLPHSLFRSLHIPSAHPTEAAGDTLLSSHLQ